MALNGTPVIAVKGHPKTSVGRDKTPSSTNSVPIAIDDDLWLSGNPEAYEAVREGLEQAARGELTPFAVTPYATADIDE